MRYILFFLILPLPIFGQIKSPQTDQFAGVWTAYLYNDSTRQTIHLELAISGSQGKYSGYTYTVFEIEGKRNIGVKAVKIKQKRGFLFLEDEKLIDNNYEEPRAKGVRVYMELHYSVNDTTQILTGLWKTNQTAKYTSVRGKIYLAKKNLLTETEIIPKLRQLGRLSRLSFIREPLPFSKTNKADKSVDVAQKDENNKQNIEIVKIIPDTTIVNEEITIFMYPKGEDFKGVDKMKKAKPGNEHVPEKDSFYISNIDSTVSLGEKLKTQEVVEQTTDNKIPIQKKTDPLQDVRRRLNSSVADNNTEPGAFPSKGAAQNLAEREIETIRTVEILSDSLVFSLFDNGSIDGDTVSVLLNGKVIMPRIGLLSRAVNKTIYLTPAMGDSITIILYAENLGSIPPNTGLLVVRDGEINYEIRFSGDLKKNSALIIKRKSKIYEQ